MSPALLHFEQFAAGRMIAAVWQASLLVMLAALALRLAPRLSAAARFAAWSAVFATILLLPFAQHARTGGAVTGWTVSTEWSAGLAVLWLLLSSWRAVQLALEFLRVRRIRAEAYPLRLAAEAPAEANAGALRLAQAADETHGELAASLRSVNATLCLSGDVTRPTVMGFFRPAILIPQQLYNRLNAAELEHILLHEAQHLRRRDLWLNLLQKIGLVLFPLNPALFWVERRLCFERELACDESVLEATNAPQSYARSLVSLAEHSLLGRQISLALGAWGQPSELSRRVYRILARRSPSLSSRSASAIVVFLCAGLLASATALSGAPRLVSFGNSQSGEMASVARPPVNLGDTARVIPVSDSAARPHLVQAIARSAPVAAETQTKPHRTARLNRGTAPRRLLASYAAPSRHDGAQRVETRFVAVSHSAQRNHEMSGPAMQTVRSRTQPNVVMLTVFTSTSAAPEYAAVPVANGWIVFQL